jgi:hypothetical protein
MDIHDSRTVLDFQKFTFSGHLRAHVYKVLDENIKLGHADYACYWTLELICSGLVHSYWNTIFLSSATHLCRSPNVFLYLSRMYERFAPYEERYSIRNMTDIRNNSEVRQLLCEVSAACALCKKSKILVLPKIKPEHDFTPLVIQESLKAPSNTYARSIMKQEDPMELFVPVNELIYCLSQRDTRALYWISWILSFASKYKAEKKEYLLCSYRSNDYVEEQYLRSPIWIIWACINQASTPQIGEYNNILFKMYCLRWSKGDLKRRLPFLITAVTYICEPLDLYPVPQSISAVQEIVINIPQWINAIVQTKKVFE